MGDIIIVNYYTWYYCDPSSNINVYRPFNFVGDVTLHYYVDVLLKPQDLNTLGNGKISFRFTAFVYFVSVILLRLIGIFCNAIVKDCMRTRKLNQGDILT